MGRLLRLPHTSPHDTGTQAQGISMCGWKAPGLEALSGTTKPPAHTRLPTLVTNCNTPWLVTRFGAICHRRPSRCSIKGFCEMVAMESGYPESLQPRRYWARLPLSCTHHRSLSDNPEEWNKLKPCQHAEKREDYRQPEDLSEESPKYGTKCRCTD